MHYGHNTKPYLLSHLKPSAAVQRAAAQASAILPAALRRVADFYTATYADTRQEALDMLLSLLQEPLQQQYAGMWGPDAISVFVVKVDKSHFFASVIKQFTSCQSRLDYKHFC